MSELLGKALGVALLVGLLGAAGYAAWHLESPLSGSRTLTMTVFEPALNASAGYTVAFPVSILNQGSAARDLTVTAASTGVYSVTPRAVTAAAGQRASVWVNVSIAAAAPPGEYVVRFLAQDADGAAVAHASVRLRVLGAGEGLRDGDRATIRFAMQLPDGRTFDGSLPFAEEGFALADEDFQPRSEAATWNYTINGPAFLAGSAPFMAGMQEGEARTILVPSAFGARLLNDEFERERVIELEIRTLPGETAPTRGNFTRWLAATQQSNANLRPGDTITWFLVLNTTSSPASERALVPVPATIVSIGANDAATMQLELPDVGETFTVFSAFRNQTRIVEKTDTAWRIRTIPAFAPLAPFTFAPQWPNGTRITTCSPTCDYDTASTITVTHLDETWINRTFRLPVNDVPFIYRVTALTDDRIRVEYLNPSQLRGLDVTYHIRLIDLARP